MRFASIALLITLASSALAQSSQPRPQIRILSPRLTQEAQEAPMNPVDDSPLDDARNEIRGALPQLRHLLNQLEQLQADSGGCSEQVPSALRPRYGEQMPALRKSLETTETAVRKLERDPLNPEALADVTMLVDSARVVSLRWAALLPKCKAFQGFATEQVTLPLDGTDPVIVMRKALAQLAGVRDKQVKQLRLMLETAGSRVQGE
jgi:hypothetical protein